MPQNTYTKWPQNIQWTTEYTKWPQNIPNGREIYQMAVKCTNIFRSEALHNIPNWDFCNEKEWVGNPGLRFTMKFDDKIRCPAATTEMVPFNWLASSRRPLTIRRAGRSESWRRKKTGRQRLLNRGAGTMNHHSTIVKVSRRFNNQLIRC
jgi:hypothetical protein